MTTTTATPSPLTPAELAEHYDAQIARLQAEKAAEKQREQAEFASRRAEIDAAILALCAQAGIDAEDFEITPDDRHPVNRLAVISMPYFATTKIRGENYATNGINLKIRPANDNTFSTPGTPDNLSKALLIARAAYRDQQEKERLEQAAEAARQEQRRQREAEQAAALAAKKAKQAERLAAWAPLYRQYCTDLAGAHAHNAAILQPIAEELAAAEFQAARFDYGITSSDAEATTIRTWVIGAVSMAENAGRMIEIDESGITEAATFFHMVRLGDLRTWTAAQVDATQVGRWNHTTTPPIRRFQAGDLGAPAEFIGPPSAEPLRAEIGRRLAEGGHELADEPQLPEAPGVDNDALIETAARIEAEQMTPAERAALARYLVAGRMDTEIPF